MATDRSEDHFNSATTKHPITVGILTVSDRCYNKQAQDSSGPVLAEAIKNSEWFDGVVIETAIVPDEKSDIIEKLKLWCNVGFNVIFTTGGTGFAPRDVTPEATKEIIEREAPGLMVAIMQGSLKLTEYAMLSRGVCGIRDRSIILNFPGKPEAAKQCFGIVSSTLPHAVQLLRCHEIDKKLLDLHQKCGDVNQPTEISKLGDLHTILPAEECHQDKSKVDVTNVADRPRESTYPKVSVEYAQEEIKSLSIQKRPQNIQLKHDAEHIQDYIGYVVAEDVFSDCNLPPFRASVKDGYAVISADGDGRRKVVGNVIAGSKIDDDELILENGSCIRVSTGAQIPRGANAVVQVENTKLISKSADGQESEIQVLHAPSVSQDIRNVGHDITIGQKIMSEGAVIRYGELAALACIGANNIKVYKKAAVAVLSTGNELVSPSEPLCDGHIRDCNKTGLVALFKSNGYETFDVGIASDDPNEIYRTLKKGLSCANIVVVTGGVSMGEKDLVKCVLLTDFDASIHFGRVNMKPGLPTTFASLIFENRMKFVFGLPGNPVSALVTSNLFVLPCLKILSGYSREDAFPAYHRATVGKRFFLDERPEFKRMHLKYDGGTYTPFADFGDQHQMSSNILSMVGANALAVLPAKSNSKNQVIPFEIIDVAML